MNSTMNFADLYGGASPSQQVYEGLEPIYTDNQIAKWFIGILILYALYYTLTEFVL